MISKIKILVVDDHPVVRQGVVSMIREYGEKFHIVGEAVDPHEGIAKAKALQPDVVVTDLMFNGETRNGIDIVKELSSQMPSVKCILITSNMQGHYMVDAFKAGAKAFLYKDSNGKEYVRAIESAFDGMTYFPPDFATEMDRWERLPKLTPSEKRVLPYVAKGLKHKQIAKEYNYLDRPKVINERTIEQHRNNIRQKFGIEGGALMAFAIKYCEDNGIDYQNLKVHTKRSLLGF